MDVMDMASMHDYSPTMATPASAVDNRNIASAQANQPASASLYAGPGSAGDASYPRRNLGGSMNGMMRLINTPPPSGELKIPPYPRKEFEGAFDRPPRRGAAHGAVGKKKEDLVEIGNKAVWTLTSAKPGNGIHQLRDNSPDTYWQSDGLSPHTISCTFSCKQTISLIMLYLDYTLDESYTPKKIAVSVGMCRDDIEGGKVEVVEVSCPETKQGKND